MHPDLLIILASQRIAELHERSRHRLPRGPRRSLRERLGRRLVRWGHRLAPATPWAGASTSRRRPATMGP